MFGNAPRAVWERWAMPDERHRIALACRCLLVQDTGQDGTSRNVLLETGIGAFFEPKLRDRFGVLEPEHVLLNALASCGLSHEDIDVVVLSHLHFDHAGGMLSAYEEGAAPTLLFPNATVVVGERAWERALSPHSRDRASFIPTLNEQLRASGRLEVVTGETSASLGPGFRFHVSDGHTPGMLLTEIAMPDGPVLFCADLIPGTPWVHVPITMGYDRFPERLIDEKRALLTDLHGRGGRLFYTHDPDVALSNIAVDDRGRFRADAALDSLKELAS